ncbi:MAG: c-type cytochrome biogenesis protein CcmI [Pseudomonadota bacterium]
MAAFVAIAVGMTLVALLSVLAGLRARPRDDRASRAQINAEVLRQQLDELERERERGALDEAEFRSARDDLQRRVLADAAAAPARPRRSLPRGSTRAVLAALPLAALAIYLLLGSPRFAAHPFSIAPDGSDAPRGAVTAVELEAHLARSPRDARAWVMLARLRMQADLFAPAADAYAKAIEVSPKVAADAGVWCEYADALGMAQGGSLAGRPRELIGRALALNAAHPRALEMAGSAAYEARDFRAAADYWRRLLAQLAPGTPEHAQLAAAIERAETRARFSLPLS